ncbi:hypothetical protein OHA25_41125 [Nonomuraea sp. NBC_00507]|uniref:hypothetical protein n=1 Tax=Nonomuraea sp. NBC_00507 TaxID=2976002 RepID=UPI002E178B93
MRRIRAASIILAATVTVLALAVPQASAHQWGSWHWNRYGATVTIQIYNTATYRTEAQAAVNDWNNNTILSLPGASGHTDISLFDGNYGNTGWGGLAEIINYSGSHITHGHARLNYYYSYSSSTKRGIFCQEIGHLFGLDHSNDGCMGLGYYNNVVTTVQHNWNDIYNMYRNSHHTAAATEADTVVTGIPRYSAVWHYQPKSVAQAVRMGKAIVRATVTDVRQADDLVVSAQGEPGEADKVPTQAITVSVDETIKGATAGTFTLFRTGTDAAGIADDPSYQVGQQYVLILDGQRDDGRQVVLSPEGRYLINAGAVHTFSQIPGVNRINGMSYDEFRALIGRHA